MVKVCLIQLFLIHQITTTVAYPVGLVLCNIFHKIYGVYIIIQMLWYVSVLKIRLFK
jgi:hypothetical protein